MWIGTQLTTALHTNSYYLQHNSFIFKIKIKQYLSIYTYVKKKKISFTKFNWYLFKKNQTPCSLYWQLFLINFIFHQTIQYIFENEFNYFMLLEHIIKWNMNFWINLKYEKL